MDEQAEVLGKFGRRLRELRKSKGLSQEQLGLECDLSQTYLSEVELGKRNVSLLNIHALAKTLGVTLAQFMEGVD